MTPDMELGVVLRRISSGTSVLRTRSQQNEWLAKHGKTNGERDAVVRQLVAELTVVAERLEAAIV